ncbi:MAG TPA: ATP-binding cassette domain-containing protein [Conexibacter sp.]|nr:ATP-binding cassette domain-containing protein [Conexibacter sp.]
MSLLAFETVTKHAPDVGGRAIALLDEVSFELGAGESVGVWGMRRCGKSTMLRLAAGVQPPDAGVVRFEGRDLARMSRSDVALLLRTKIGFAPMERHATRNEVVVDHVALPALSLGASLRDAQIAARTVLERVGVTSRADARMAELAPGEHTRVAIARGLVREPSLLLVDEPGATPSPTDRDEIYTLLRELAKDPELTLVVASEDVAAIRTARRAMTLSDGALRSSDRASTVVQFPRRRAERAD